MQEKDRQTKGHRPIDGDRTATTTTETGSGSGDLPGGDGKGGGLKRNVDHERILAEELAKRAQEEG